MIYVIQYSPYTEKDSWVPLYDGLGGPEITFCDLKKATTYLRNCDFEKRTGERFRLASKKTIITYTPIQIDENEPK